MPTEKKKRRQRNEQEQLPWAPEGRTTASEKKIRTKKKEMQIEKSFRLSLQSLENHTIASKNFIMKIQKCSGWWKNLEQVLFHFPRWGCIWITLGITS